MPKPFLSTCFLLLLWASTAAQDFSENWTGYFSYNTINSITAGSQKVYAAADNSVFSYDLTTQEIETFSTIEGLSGEAISAIYFSESKKILFVGYQSGLIDVVMPDGKVLKVVDIVNKNTIPPNAKQINHFLERDGIVYISAAFGISLYNIERLEFDDSYFIGPTGGRLNVRQTAIAGDFIYAATQEGGVRRALVAARNLIDFRNWSTVANGNWPGIVASGNALFALNADNSLQRFNGGSFNTVASYPGTVRNMTTNGTTFSVTLGNQVFVYDAAGASIAQTGTSTQFPSGFNAAFTIANGLFIGTSGNGLLVSSLDNPTASEQVLPSGPLRNDPFSIEASPGQLWVVYGDYSDRFNPFPLKRRPISHLREGTGWINTPFTDLLGANNLVNITINPADPEQVFLSGYNSGVLEINADVPTRLYDEKDGLSDIPINRTDVRINGAAFDRQGALWVTNSFVENAFAKKNVDRFQGFSVKDVIPDFDRVDAYTDLAINRSDQVFFSSNNRGLIAYDPASGALAQLAGEDSGLPINDIRALAFDGSGTLWMGTTVGLRLLFGPGRIFEGPDLQATPIIIEEGGVAVELLSEQNIQSIVVDGSNNKWIGTAGNGVFYLSSTGQETLLRFNTGNSPLPSDIIRSISIDAVSGRVYFATTLGLVAYDGSAVAPADDLEAVRAFPNPVRPNFTGQVTIDGLTSRANVKITDIAGNLVYEAVSEGGSIQWDTTAFGRHKVASGVYMILVTSSDASETKVAKVMIIR